ncbi:nucleotide exchange factor GrpE [Galbibacter sp. BG1]|uniref:nucleotide exchange factor GrpE n=1 Tax=Galbibacter sp. BG1 TaxID=1170699 RepID=UPI0015B93C0B|nr:nucleotide exchange factor GrpE [Galbibacter sp. BG1]QLE02149.1 nucleotide exchange factor GrpE [Galbibacter sp. BG1]
MSKNEEKEIVSEENLAEGQGQDQIQEDQVSEVNDAKDEISEEEKLREELAAEKDKFLRLFAEFENYKRRTSKERIELFKTAGQDIMVSMLPVLDDFDRALNEISKTEDKELLKGVELISNKFRNTLNNKGLEQIEVNVGDVFDAELHEAITQIPAPSDDLKGKIVDVIEKGYKLGERVIRHPKVIVGQ